MLEQLVVTDRRDQQQSAEPADRLTVPDLMAAEVDLRDGTERQGLAVAAEQPQ